MENFEKIAIALIIFVITSVVAYLFRMRQLYVVTPKLYRHTPITKNGSLCELHVYNKGNQVEESVLVELDPDLKCELLASSSSEMQLAGSSIKIERLHKGTDASAILLVENGILDHTKITAISSKGTNGTICKKVSDVPPNYAKFSLTLVAMLSFLPALIYGEKAYKELSEYFVQYKLKTVAKMGWSNLASYSSSDLAKSYSNQEFPIRYLNQEISEDHIKLFYEIYNKTASELHVYAQKKKNNEAEKIDIRYFSGNDVPPMSKKQFSVAVPLPSSGINTVQVDFFFKLGNEYIHDLDHSVNVDIAKKTGLSAKGKK
jgi:hypothetical protein